VQDITPARVFATSAVNAQIQNAQMTLAKTSVQDITPAKAFATSADFAQTLNVKKRFAKKSARVTN
jgi:hypothetical protein